MPRAWALLQLTFFPLLALATAAPARAQPSDASDAGASAADAGVNQTQAEPPRLKTSVEATYPPEARAQRLEGTVGLELRIDEQGKVEGVTVVTPAGHGFDEAATVAARQFTFEPARRAGKAIPSTIQFSYEFHLPAEPTPTPAPTPTPTPTQEAADQTTLVLATRPISAASSTSVRDRDFTLRPIGSVQDILRVTPGLVVVQHAGGGKATQYFLRGFDADHGTDLALSIDGIPINLVSHAHGQGYADTNFIVPELVERVEITKGPYFADQADFATAGAVNLVTRKEFEHSSVGLGLGGSPGYGAPSWRALGIASPKFENIRPLFVAEIGRQDGPFDNPEGWNKYKLWNKVSFDLTPTSTLTVGESSYASDWHGSGQIPERAVQAGTIPRFGTIDPYEGGDTARHQVSVAYRLRPTDASELSALAYAAAYRFNLFSNFTLFLRDPENGDEIEQVDRRTFYGGKASYRFLCDACGVKLDTTLGANARSDDIHDQLWHTRDRERLGENGDHNVHESTVGAFLREEMTPFTWLRVIGGTRADFFSFAVDDNLHPGQSGVKGASQISPKASLIVSPLVSGIANDTVQREYQWDVYVNYGQGFHSNDARGVVLARNGVTPLARALGSEVGTRARMWDRLDLAAALWQLDLQSEIVWNGDEGTTEASERTHREGVELEGRYEFTKWLAADLDLTFTRSRFVQNAGNGNGLALAPKQTWSGGLSARHPNGLRAGLRVYGIGDRPATDDGALVAEGFTLVDLHAGYRHRRFDVAFDVENLLDAKARSAQFATTGRLRDEPATNAPAPPGTCGFGSRPAPSGVANNFAGCEDVHFTPAYPLTVRVMTTLFLD